MLGKNNLLFIDSDNDSESQQPTPKSNKKIASYKMAGGRRMAHQAITRGLFVNQNAEDYTYEIEDRRDRKKSLGDVHDAQKVCEDAGFIYMEQVKTEPVKLDLLINEEERQKEKEEKEQKIKPITKTKKNLLTFHFADSGNSSSDEEEQNQNRSSSSNHTSSNPCQDSDPETKENIDDEVVPQGQSNIVSKFSLKSIVMVNKADKIDFALQTVPKGSILETTVIKSNPAFNFFYPIFNVYFKKQPYGHIISGKKQFANTKSQFPMSIDPEHFGHLQGNYIGKTKHLSGTNMYNIFDDGISPEDLRGNLTSRRKRRQIIATVTLTVGKGPRHMEVFILKEGVKYTDMISFPKEEPTLYRLYSFGNYKDKIHYFRTRKPQWIEQRQEYFLDFRGKVKEASVRNFVLENPQTGEEVLLFGKKQDNYYHMDISYPLSPRLALGIVLPMFDQEG